MMTHFTDTFSTPFGSFSIAVDGKGALVATAFGNTDQLRHRFDAGVLISDPAACRTVRDQVLAYCSGERREFSIVMAPHGTEFQS
ncbi:MAG: methylated-DNA--[protein]-cysteine S-methyltransferase, partial [Opitutaceae bacterium]